MSTFLKGRELSELEAAALEVLVKTIAPNPEEYRVDEAVHPMGVHVTSVSGKKVEGLPAYKVTKVGSKVKQQGGVTVGEHLHDNHLDDLADMGHKIKNEQVTTEANSRMFKAKGQYSTGEPNPISTNGDTVSGPQDQLQKKAEGKMNLIQASVKEISQRAKSNGTQKESNEDVEEVLEDMHDSEEGMSKDAKKKVTKGKSKYKGLDDAKGDDDKDAVDKDGVAEGALGTGIGAVGGAALGGPVGAAVGGVAGHMAQQGLKKLGKKIKSGIAGFSKPQTAESMNKMKEETEVDFTIIEHNSFTIELPEELLFADFLNAAKMFTESHNEAVKIADAFFGQNDESIIFEAFTRGDIEDRISAHAKAGKAVSMPKYGMNDGKPTAEYTVTEDAGSKITFMHHGNIRRVTRN